MEGFVLSWSFGLLSSSLVMPKSCLPSNDSSENLMQSFCYVTMSAVSPHPCCPIAGCSASEPQVQKRPFLIFCSKPLECSRPFLCNGCGFDSFSFQPCSHHDRDRHDVCTVGEKEATTGSSLPSY